MMNLVCFGTVPSLGSGFYPSFDFFYDLLVLILQRNLHKREKKAINNEKDRKQI